MSSQSVGVSWQYVGVSRECWLHQGECGNVQIECGSVPAELYTLHTNTEKLSRGKSQGMVDKQGVDAMYEIR